VKHGYKNQGSDSTELTSFGSTNARDKDDGSNCSLGTFANQMFSVENIADSGPWVPDQISTPKSRFVPEASNARSPFAASSAEVSL